MTLLFPGWPAAFKPLSNSNPLQFFVSRSCLLGHSHNRLHPSAGTLAKHCSSKSNPSFIPGRRAAPCSTWKDFLFCFGNTLRSVVLLTIWDGFCIVVAAGTLACGARLCCELFWRHVRIGLYKVCAISARDIKFADGSRNWWQCGQSPWLQDRTCSRFQLSRVDEMIRSWIHSVAY